MTSLWDRCDGGCSFSLPSFASWSTGISHGSKEMYPFRFLGKKTRRTLNVCRPLYRLWYRSIYLERRTVVCVPIGPLTVLIRPLTVQIWSVTVPIRSYGSFGKKGLPALCSILPPASELGVLCCTATRTALSVLSHTLYNHGPPSVKLPQALCWSAIAFSVTRAVISLLPNILDAIYYWPFIFCFLGQLHVQWPSLLPLLDVFISELLPTAPAHVD